MVCGTRTTRELIWRQANMGWFLRWVNWVVAKMIQVLYGGPSLTDCGMHAATHPSNRPLDASS
jgi:hypothetical protein